MFVLARRGLSMLKAKRQIEAVIETGQATVELPTVEDTSAVVAEPDTAGFEAQLVQLSTTLDVRHVRQKLGLSREQFALHYGLEVEAVRNWKTGKREPDAAARSYLRVISNAPEQVGLAYAQNPSPQHRRACDRSWAVVGAVTGTDRRLMLARSTPYTSTKDEGSTIATSTSFAQLAIAAKARGGCHLIAG